MYDYDRYLEDPQSEEFIQAILHDGHAFMVGYRKFLKTRQGHEYFITFTLDPSKGPFNYDVIEAYINTICDMKQIACKQWYTVREYTKKGIAHWHCFVRSNAIIRKDYLRTYIKKYGSVDIRKVNVGTSESVLQYMEKDSQPVCVFPRAP